jgi:hypothetical protein
MTLFLVWQQLVASRRAERDTRVPLPLLDDRSKTLELWQASQSVHGGLTCQA